MTLAADNAKSEDALVAALGRGDEAALGAIYHRYAALVFTIAARVLDAGRAEGIVQDVFLAIWSRRKSFDPARGSFKAWISRIARNHALNELRRQRGAPESSEVLETVADDALEPDEALWVEHRRAAIRAAVDVLPAPQRKALSLAFFDELTHEQVAAALSIPVGTAKTRIRLALKRLAPILATVLALCVLVIWRRSDERRARDERALRVVTSSDVVPLRLEHAANGAAPADAHGQYRVRPGGDLAVVTTSRLAPASRGERYVVWVRHGARWSALGAIDVARDGRSLDVFEGADVASPDEVRVARETETLDAPHGPTLIAWPSAN